MSAPEKEAVGAPAENALRLDSAHSFPSRPSRLINLQDSLAFPSGPALDESGKTGCFTVACRRLSREEWDALLPEFQDANLYQTWCYAAVRWGAKNLSHLLLKDGPTVVGAAQVVLIELPVVRGGLAYVKWGPLWVRRGRDANPQVFRTLLRALRQVYARERGFLLRVSPWEFENTELLQIPCDEGFRRNMSAQQRTAVLDLTYSMDELRASLTRHWRSNLKRAESNHLEIVDGQTEDLFDEFAGLHRQMRARKGGGWIPPIHYVHQVQCELAERTKAHISLCRHDGRSVAGLMVSALGDKSFAWLAATGDAGQELRGSYLLQWRTIERLKSQGVRSYDLGGVNEVTHPGTAQFKLGLCGKRGRVVDYLGEFEACEAWISRVAISGIDPLRLALLRIQQFWEERWHRRAERKQASKGIGADPPGAGLG